MKIKMLLIGLVLFAVLVSVGGYIALHRTESVLWAGCYTYTQNDLETGEFGRAVFTCSSTLLNKDGIVWNSPDFNLVTLKTNEFHEVWIGGNEDPRIPLNEK
ncbi:hypothetical protein HYV31_00475 [candidate division WWE3 bacterium]|nr:hypothetical protein [candidate division WWE3 bacterium]